MSKIYSIEPSDFIDKLAEDLKAKKLVEPPEWSGFVKTGVHKERPPVDSDWWYVRSAAILRSVFRLGPIGTSKLRVKYGGRKNRGVKPEHTFKASGNIIRKILQQLENSKLVVQVENQKRKGRILTKEGKELLNTVVKSLNK